MVIGKDFEVCSLITNNYMKKRSCKVVFMASAVGYNGKLGEYCGFSVVEVELAPDEGTLSFLTLAVRIQKGLNSLCNFPPSPVRRIPLKLQYKSYASTITSERLIRVMVMTLDGENEDYKTAAKTIVLDGPDIEIKVQLDCGASCWGINGATTNAAPQTEHLSAAVG